MFKYLLDRIKVHIAPSKLNGKQVEIYLRTITGADKSATHLEMISALDMFSSRDNTPVSVCNSDAGHYADFLLYILRNAKTYIYLFGEHIKEVYDDIRLLPALRTCVRSGVVVIVENSGGACNKFISECKDLGVVVSEDLLGSYDCDCAEQLPLNFILCDGRIIRTINHSSPHAHLMFNDLEYCASYEEAISLVLNRHGVNVDAPLTREEKEVVLNNMFGADATEKTPLFIFNDADCIQVLCSVIDNASKYVYISHTSRDLQVINYPQYITSVCKATARGVIFRVINRVADKDEWNSRNDTAMSVTLKDTVIYSRIDPSKKDNLICLSDGSVVLIYDAQERDGVINPNDEEVCSEIKKDMESIINLGGVSFVNTK